MQDVLREMTVKVNFVVNSAPMRQIDAHLGKLERRLDRIRRNSMTGMSTSFDSLARNSRRMAIGLTGATAGLGVFLNEAGQFNKTRIAFETMTGSVERGRDLLKEMNGFALETPFTVREVEDNAAMLLGMGIEADNVKRTMKALGDVAAGINRPLGMVALNYGQIKTRGVLMGTELRDFARQGVPIIEQLAKQLGVNQSAIQDMASNREISFGEVEKAFMAMTSGQGRFADLMVKQAKTWPVMMSNFLIWLRFIARDIGQELLPKAKEYLALLQEWVRKNRDLIKDKFVETLKVILKILGAVGRTVRWLIPKISELVDLFGGFEKTLKMIMKILAGIILFQMAKLLGNMVVAFGSLVVQMGLLITGAATFTSIMGLLPILIGAAVIVLALLIEDFKTFQEGGKSLVGDLIKEYEGLYTTLKNISDVIEFIFKDRTPKIDMAPGEALQNLLGFGKNNVFTVDNASSIMSKLANNPMGIQRNLLDLGGLPGSQRGQAKSLHQDITIQIDGATSPNVTADAVKTALEGTVYKDLYTNSGGYAVSPTGN